MKQRVLSGIVLVILLVLTLVPGGVVLSGVSMILSLIAYRELTKAIGLANNNDRPNLIFCFTDIEVLGYVEIIVYYILMTFVKDLHWLFLAVFGILITFMALYVFTFPKYQAKDIMMGFFSLLYGPVTLGFLYLIRELNYGEYLIWMVFISSWVSDTFAYFVGMALGKHRLAPVLSPKKSIEGAIGGVVGSALVGALYGYLLIERLIPGHHIVVFLAVIGAFGSIVSQIGDLAASGIKRNQDIKDYGNLIPGHGGIMDRFDSVIFTAPMVYMLSLLALAMIG